MNKLTLKDLDLRGKRVLMRVDFNVPLDGGRVTDDMRIKSAVPSIRHVIDNGGRLVLMSHLGRPKGKRVPDMSLLPCVAVLKQLLGQDVRFVDDCIGPEVQAAVNSLGDGEVLLLENLRYHGDETANNPEFARQLAAFGDVFVNDAFGTVHRAHASTHGVTAFIDRCAAGFLVMKEMEYLDVALENPERPFIAILGGAKISGKIDVISNLLPKVDKLIVGGGMAFTFFKAMGYEIGNSLLEMDKLELAGELLSIGREKIVLPVDCLVSDVFDFPTRRIGPLNTVAVDAIPVTGIGLDIGPETLRIIENLLTAARTIVWNGPMGVFEIDETAGGTFAVAEIMARATTRGAVTIVGGGDSAAAIAKAGAASAVSHVSTGGGASLEFLEGKTLPGVDALSDKPVAASS
ncbi:MAG: phosphoglycerate kinase [Desulfobacteraceae bacterium]|nr:phosphoglycerate kinase [Desulfobacteraceae bacterium]